MYECKQNNDYFELIIQLSTKKIFCKTSFWKFKSELSH